MNRPRAPRLGVRGALRALAIATSTLAVAGCGTTTSTPSPGTGTAAPTGGPSGAAALTVRAYFILGSFQDNAGLAPVERSIDAGAGGAAEGGAIKALLAGPSDAELGARPAFRTDIPAGTRLLDISVAGETATVNLSGEFDDEGQPGSLRGRLAQVVYTATQFPGVTNVLLQIDGKAVTSFGSEGVATGESLQREDFNDQLAAVFVDRPAWGSVIPNPLRITGTADVFEANFHVRLLAPDGRSLADGPVMATCGTGCRGTFDATIPYTATAAGPATLQVYTLSEVDGSQVQLTEYPVTLTPTP